jgi:hypothetical protein
MDITTDDLMDAIRAALGNGAGDARTVQEICDACGWKPTKVRQELRALHRQGRLDVIRVNRPDLTGRSQSIPGYRMKDA